MFILWHPDSPGVKVAVRGNILRRVGACRSDFATLGEVLNKNTRYFMYTSHKVGDVI